MIEGAIPETQALLEIPWDKILFTGSYRVASLIQQQLARTQPLTPVIYELGGKSPCIVAEDADIAAAARRITQSTFVNAGQSCVAPDYLLVHRRVKGALVEAMKECITEFFGADPQRSPDFPRLINLAAFHRMEALLQRGRIVSGGHCDESDLYVAPTLLEVEPATLALTLILPTLQS